MRCVECGVEFRRISNAKLCSDKCRSDRKKKREEKRRRVNGIEQKAFSVNRNCNLCGIEFRITPTRLKRSSLNFCSDACHRKKNTLHGWVVRCNRKFQKRCRPKNQYVPLTRNGSWDGWCKAAAAEKHEHTEKTLKQKWAAKISSMVNSSKYREDTRGVKIRRIMEDRDREMLREFQEGRTKAEIAKSHGISFENVKATLRRERIRQGQRCDVQKSVSWESSILRMIRSKQEVDEWSKKINGWITNQRKRMKKKFVLAGSHQQASEQYLSGRVIGVQSQAKS